LILDESAEAQEAIQQLSSMPDAELTFAGVNYKVELLKIISLYRDYSEVDDFLL
jgi:hypothetical protein